MGHSLQYDLNGTCILSCASVTIIVLRVCVCVYLGMVSNIQYSSVKFPASLPPSLPSLPPLPPSPPSLPPSPPSLPSLPPSPPSLSLPTGGSLVASNELMLRRSSFKPATREGPS